MNDIVKIVIASYRDDYESGETLQYQVWSLQRVWS